MKDMDNSGPVVLPGAVAVPKAIRKTASKKKKVSVGKRLIKAAKKARKKVVARGERLDLRLTKSEKAKVSAKAKATRRSVTSIISELIEKMK